MLNERKFDHNQIIGFLLIGLILIGFSIIQKPEKPTASNKGTSTEKVPVAKNVQSQNQTTLKTARLDSLTPKIVVERKNWVLENDNIKVEIETPSGLIQSVILKKFFAYDAKAKDHHKPLELVSRGGLSYGFVTASKLDTKSLLFTLKSFDKNKLILSSLSPYGVIEYEYHLTGDYDLKWKVHAPTKFKRIYWNQRLNALEKGKSQETQYSEFLYSYNNYSGDDYWASRDFQEQERMDWLAIKQQFFTTIIEPDKQFIKGYGSQKTLEDSRYIKEFRFGAYEPGNEFTLHFLPLDKELLVSYNKNFEIIIPFGGWIIRWLCEFFLWLYKLLDSFGIAAGWIIFLMTIIVKLITSPIMYKQFKQSAMMRVLKPDLEEMNARLKGADPLKKQQATMEIYRKAGVNPLAGCLPALLQIPIFYALFRFFPNVIDLRGKSFLWAEDLTAYESIVNLPFEIPFYGSHVSLFALLYCVVLLIYTKMTASNLQQPTQEGMPDMRFLMYLMPVLFIFFLNSYASGLSWYYLVSNTLNILIIIVIRKYLIDEAAIHAKIQENKTKPVKASKWQQRMQMMMEQAQKQRELQQKRKR